MTKILLKHGPCDPRDLEMVVSVDATEVKIRPMPFQVYDVYQVVDRFEDHGALVHATGEYVRTEGSRQAVTAYRRELARIGLGRAFTVKLKGAERVH